MERKLLIIVLVLTVLIGSGLFTMCSMKEGDKLEVYTDADTVSVRTPSPAAEKILELMEYDNEEDGISMCIPTDWNKVIKDGFETYIHSPSGTSVQIQIRGYDPALNNITQTEISADITGQGYSFIAVNFLTSSWYEVLYRDKEQIYDYIMEVHWNREYTVVQQIVVKDEYYEAMLAEISEIVNSFEFSRAETVIPEDYYLYYMPDFACEIGIPIEWIIGQTENALVAVSPDSAAQMSFTATAYDGYLDSLTTINIAELFGSGKSGFIVNEFETSLYMASVKYTYGDGIANTTFMYVSGEYLYTLSFDYYENIDEVINRCDGLLRYFF